MVWYGLVEYTTSKGRHKPKILIYEADLGRYVTIICPVCVVLNYIMLKRSLQISPDKISHV